MLLIEPTPTPIGALDPTSATIARHVQARAADARAALQRALDHLEPALVQPPHPFPEVMEAIEDATTAVADLTDALQPMPDQVGTHTQLHLAADEARTGIDALAVRDAHDRNVRAAVHRFRLAAAVVDDVIAGLAATPLPDPSDHRGVW